MAIGDKIATRESYGMALAALGENVPFATLCDSYCLMPTERAYFCFNHS